MRPADPIVDLLLAADLPGIAARAREGRARAIREKAGREIAEAWKLAEEACRELMPVEAARHSTVQPALFPMSRVKSARKRRSPR
jgi:hypothetical protein